MTGIAMYKPGASLISQMSAKCDGDRNATRADSEREGQRKECVLESVLERARLHFLRRVICWLIKEIPTRYRHDQTSGDLHDEQRNAEEGEDFTAEERRNNQQDKSISRDLVRQNLLRGLRIVPGWAEENRGTAAGLTKRE